LAGDAAWGDYRLSVQLGSDDPNGVIGALFAYQDADNHYKLSLNLAAGTWRLSKKTGGNASQLQQGAVTLAAGLDYLLTVDCSEGEIAVYLDDEPLARIEDDDDHSKGQVGLYVWANQAARFGELRLAPAVWRDHFTFGKEPPLPAGTRLRLHSGNRREAPSATFGIEQRFAASLGSPGQLRFSPNGVSLRLRAPNGTIGHTRRFLPDSEYAPVDSQKVRVLRKADGTGFFLTLQGTTGPDLGKAAYRLRLKYRRDNRSQQQNSLVLSKANDRSDEVVILDIIP
jgi:hypothetical protein